MTTNMKTTAFSWAGSRAPSVEVKTTSRVTVMDTHIASELPAITSSLRQEIVEKFTKQIAAKIDQEIARLLTESSLHSKPESYPKKLPSVSITGSVSSTVNRLNWRGTVMLTDEL